MKKRTLLITVLFLSSAWVFSQADTLSKEGFDALSSRVLELEKWKNAKIYIASIVAAAISIIGLLGGWAILKKKLDSLMVEALAKKLEIKVEVLEDALKTLSKDYDSKNNKQILIVSQKTGENADMRTLLMSIGFKPTNLDFKGVEDDISFKQKDLVVFNGHKDSILSKERIGQFIEKNRIQIKSYFYFGPERDLPLDNWRSAHSVKVGASNLENALGNGLLSFLKQL